MDENIPSDPSGIGSPALSTTNGIVQKSPIVRTIKGATEADIENAKPSTKLVFGDGFQIFINEKGTKYFQQRFCLQGSGSTRNLGTYPDMQFDQAREEARTVRAKVKLARQTKSKAAFKSRLNKPKAKDRRGGDRSPNFKNIEHAGEFIRDLFGNNNIETEIRLAIWLQMLIPSRPSELLCAQWADINRESKQWTINIQGKNDPRVSAFFNPHVEFLSTPAIAALDELYPLTDRNYLFPSLSDPNMKKSDRDNRITNEIEKIWLDYQPKVFQNFFITMANKFSYFRPEFIEAMMTHKDKKACIYNEPSLSQQKRALAEWWGEKLKMVMMPKIQTGNLIYQPIYKPII